MTVNEMIKKYSLRIAINNGQEMLATTMKLTKKDAESIKSMKNEIIAEIKRREAEKKAAYEAREAKINSIEGLEEIRKAILAEEDYREAFNRAMDRGDGRFPRKPEISSDELKKKYPRAAAYLKAEAWGYASNYVKANAGNKAKERIINGEDYSTAIADMETEWTAHCEDHIWD